MATFHPIFPLCIASPKSLKCCKDSTTSLAGTEQSQAIKDANALAAPEGHSVPMDVDSASTSEATLNLNTVVAEQIFETIIAELKGS